GSKITYLTYLKHEIINGKPKLENLPAKYVENNSEGKTLIVTLKDDVTNVEVELLYTIFTDLPIITRSARLINKGQQIQNIENLTSLSLDLPDADYDLIQLSGDRKSTRLNSSHVSISYAVFCL